jgi:hypothetical protein
MGSRMGWRRAAWWIVLLAAGWGAAGCYWLRYDALVRTHVDLLLAMARKLEAVTDERGAPPIDLAEYRYPLERARDFARIAGRRFAGRASLGALRALTDDYEAVLDAADRLRVDGGTPARAAFRDRLAALPGRGAAVVAALDDGR